jgi:hypothetical protein
MSDDHGGRARISSNGPWQIETGMRSVCRFRGDPERAQRPKDLLKLMRSFASLRMTQSALGVTQSYDTTMPTPNLAPRPRARVLPRLRA